MEYLKSDIVRKVIELAAEQATIDPAHITVESHFVNDLNFDSLNKVEFAMDIEDEFELSVPDEDVQNLQTVGEVVEYILRRLKSGEAKEPKVSV